MDLTNVTWDPIPDGEDPMMRKGTLPDGRRIHLPRRKPNAEELKRIDEMIRYNQSLPPEMLELGKKLAKQLGLEKE